MGNSNDVLDLSKEFAEITQQYRSKSEENLAYLEKVKEELGTREIAKNVATFLYKCSEITSILDYELSQNKENTYTSILAKDIHVEDVEAYTSGVFDRIAILVAKMKNPSLLLGVEYVLSNIIEKEQLEEEYKRRELEEGYDSVEDMFDSETLQNIDNRFTR